MECNYFEDYKKKRFIYLASHNPRLTEEGYQIVPVNERKPWAQKVE